MADATVEQLQDMMGMKDKNDRDLAKELKKLYEYVRDLNAKAKDEYK